VVYYKTKKIRGKPYKGSVSTELFNKIVHNVEQRKIEFSKLLSSFFKKGRKDYFKHVWVVKYDRYLRSPAGNLFVPNSLVFSEFNAGENVFPPKYFFMACIDGEIEVREVELDISKMYYERVGVDKEVSDASILDKIENSISMIYEKYKLQIDRPIVRPEIEKEEVEEVGINADTLKRLSIFLNLCINDEERETEIISNIKNLKTEQRFSTDVKDDQRYHSYHGLEILIDNTVNTTNEFIVGLDISFPADEFKDVIAELVRINFMIEVELNDKYHGSDLGLTGTDIFRDFDEDLEKYNICIGFIESGDDSYILFLHEIENKVPIRIHLQAMGLRYFDSFDT